MRGCRPAVASPASGRKNIWSSQNASGANDARGAKREYDEYTAIRSIVARVPRHTHPSGTRSRAFSHNAWARRVDAGGARPREPRLAPRLRERSRAAAAPSPTPVAGSGATRLTGSGATRFGASTAATAAGAGARPAAWEPEPRSPPWPPPWPWPWPRFSAAAAARRAASAAASRARARAQRA